MTTDATTTVKALLDDPTILGVIQNATYPETASSGWFFAVTTNQTRTMRAQQIVAAGYDPTRTVEMLLELLGRRAP